MAHFTLILEFNGNVFSFGESIIQLNYEYYILRLGSGCNLGKDLSKEVGMSQLVKHKDTGLYLQLYRPKDHE